MSRHRGMEPAAEELLVTLRARRGGCSTRPRRDRDPPGPRYVLTEAHRGAYRACWAIAARVPLAPECRLVPRSYGHRRRPGKWARRAAVEPAPRVCVG